MVSGFSTKVEGAELGRADSGLDRAVTRDHDDHRPVRLRDLLDARQRLHAVDARQPDIQQDCVEGPLGQPRQARFAVAYGFDLVSFVFKTPDSESRIPGSSSTTSTRWRFMRSFLLCARSGTSAPISDDEAAPLSDDYSRREFGAVLGHDVVHDRQTQARYPLGSG